MFHFLLCSEQNILLVLLDIVAFLGMEPYVSLNTVYKKAKPFTEFLIIYMDPNLQNQSMQSLLSFKTVNLTIIILVQLDV